MFDDISPVFDRLIKEWLASCDLEEILETNDLDDEALLHILLREGHVVPPPYLEYLLEYPDDNR